MKKRVIGALIILALGTYLGMFVFKSEPRLNTNFENEKAFYKNHPFRLGLDLSGGSHLVYKADVSEVEKSEVPELMNSLRDVIERRVNIFGVSEPVVQIQGGSFISGGDEQLIVDLPGVTDVDKAIEMIGQTPLLEFKVEAPLETLQKLKVDENGEVIFDTDSAYVSTELTGRYLKKATLQFNQSTMEPMVSLLFDETGTKLFSQITRENIGKTVAIYLDGAIISNPVVREEIPSGEAFISGNFTPAEAKQLVGRLNSGALPVPVTLVSKQTIGATLGESAVQSGVKAAVIGFLLVGIFLIIWYRLPGLIATLALSIFVIIMLFLFKLIPVTLTAAGIAGFVISIGIAVDANVLIFERVKEELRLGKSVKDAVNAGFSRAWFSIRDSNTSSIITAIILFWFGTSLVKGFALVFGMGVLVSMFSAITITKIFLRVVNFGQDNKIIRFLFSSGISR